jgi:hypothetical protein
MNDTPPKKEEKKGKMEKEQQVNKQNFQMSGEHA